MKPSLALVLAALSGYVALSQEILWFRVISYATAGAPAAFAHLLGFFLLGLALGAYAAPRLAERAGREVGLLASGLFTALALVGFFGPPSAANAYAVLDTAAQSYAYLVVALLALPSGVLFPLVCHLGIARAEAVGASLSTVYLANIAGACLGPLLTTFVLMDRLPFESLSLAVALVALAGAALPLLALDAAPGRRTAAAAAVALALALVLGLGGPAYRQLFEKLHFKSDLDPGRPYTHLVQTRSGVVARGGSIGTDTVWGGGIYDGAFNVDPAVEANSIYRAYAVALLHRAPKEVLVIGLSGGAWTRVIADHGAVQAIDAVEIDPGYLRLMERAPRAVQVVGDPKVTVHLDDGRRWLRRNPGRTFDLIVMNTTYHWRSHASNLLSQEFFRLCREHLKPGGAVYLNTTGSEAVWFTLASVFRHVVAVDHFSAASDAPFDQGPEERRQNLLRFSSGGEPSLARASAAPALERLVAWDLSDRGEALRARRDLGLVTDDNMATEFRTQAAVRYDPTRSWARVFSR